MKGRIMMIVAFLFVFLLLIILGIAYNKYSIELEPYIEVPAGYIDEQLGFQTIYLSTISSRRYAGYNILTPKSLLPQKCNCFWIDTRYRYDKNINETYIPMKTYPNSKEPLHPFMLFSIYQGETPNDPFGIPRKETLTHEYYIIKKDNLLYLIHRYALSKLLANEDELSIIAATLSSTSYSAEHFKILDRIR